MTSVLTALTIFALYIDPVLFEFSPPLWDGGTGTLIIIAITALFLLTMIMLSHGLKHRYLLDHFWALLAPDND